MKELGRFSGAAVLLFLWVLFENSGGSPSAETNHPDSDLTDQFESRFLNEVQSRPRLFEAYDTSLDPIRAGELYYEALKRSCRPLPSAESVARTVSDAVESTFDRLSQAEHVLAHAKSLARCLMRSGRLNRYNIDSLALDVVLSIDRAIDGVPGLVDRTESRIQSITNGVFDYLDSLELFTEEEASHMAEDFVYFLHSLTGTPFMDDCSTIVECFAQRYINRVQSQPSLSAIFDTTLDPQTAAAQFYRVVYLTANQTGSHDPDKVAGIVSNAIAKTWSKLTKSEFMRTQAYTIGRFLDSVNALTPENTENLADSAVHYVRVAVSELPQDEEDPRLSYIPAVAKSFVEYFKSLDLYKSYTVMDMVNDFAKYLFVFSGVDTDSSTSSPRHFEPPIWNYIFVYPEGFIHNATNMTQQNPQLYLFRRLPPRPV